MDSGSVRRLEPVWLLGLVESSVFVGFLHQHGCVGRLLQQTSIRYILKGLEEAA